MSTIAERLHQHGYRVTPHRLVILAILDGTEGHLSAKQIYNLAAIRQPGITETTVYRSLDFLTRQGMALATQAENGHLTYESAAHAHIHIACHKCGTTFEVGSDLIESAIRTIETTTGFEVDLNHHTFRGICPQCKGEKRGLE